jgi:NNP family nitrate/nitrite transporter-like MFS transporter
VQLVGLAILATAGKDHPRLLIGVYLPLVVLAALFAALFMDNLAYVTNDKHAMRDVMREPHAWVVSLLYIGTFGSFIGFAFAFGQVLQVQFASTFSTPTKAACLTFLGPLLGSLVRPVGGRLADRYGGARVTCATFIAMLAAATAVISASDHRSLALFIAGFVALFVLSGLGNGSTYKMIPAIFGARAARDVTDGGDPERCYQDARRKSRALIGIAGAIGAGGGVLVNLAFRQAFLSSHRGDPAYAAFAAFYLLCALVTWAVYLRPSHSRLVGV